MADHPSNPIAGSLRSTTGGAERRPVSNDSRQEDRNLLERVDAGDQAAMAEIFDRYSGMAYSVALRVLGDPAQAEDVMQDVFFQVWRNPKSFTPERGSLGAWLAVVIRNRCIDVRRRRRPSESVEDVILASSSDVSSEVERSTLMERVRGILTGLPAEQRESLELAFFEGMTHAEIAAQKGEPLGTVKTRIRTALQALRKALHP